MLITTQKPTLEQMPTMVFELQQGIEFLKQILSVPYSQKVEEPPIDIKEAAHFTNLDEQTIYRLLRNRKHQKAEDNFPGYKKNGKWYFYKSELNKYIKSGRIAVDFQDQAEAELIGANEKRKG